ncbi:MAG: NusG domain II-containing protein [Lachnospiraceae bacterium]|nr:NusG domain II-containing protein [Lachnospiraceae bacterium]
MKIFRRLFKNTDPDFPGRLISGKDLFLYFALIIVCLIAGAVLSIRGTGGRDGRSAAGTLEVYVNGSLYGEYETRTQRDILINAYNGTANTVHIDNGSITMSSASCRNQLCVKHAPIRYGGEEIICLPDRVVLRLSAPDKEGYDALSR